MTRVDRHALITLAGLIILESTLGWMLKDIAGARTPLFVADTLLGMLLLAFALATETSDGRRP
jgi:hypothetical protein